MRTGLRRGYFMSVSRPRNLSTVPATTAAPNTTTPAKLSEVPQTTVVQQKGSTLMQRLSSFFVGLGIGFSCTFYLVYDELVDSNSKFEHDLKALKK